MPRPLTPEQLRLRAELEATRQKLTAAMQGVLGPALEAEAVQSILEEAKAWKGPNAFRLAEHLEQHPEALTAPSPRCPASLVRLLDALDRAGHGRVVSMVGCADCARRRPLPLTASPRGRLCSACARSLRRGVCARCAQEGVLEARRPEGVICSRCKDREPESLRECVSCGRRRRPAKKLPEGGYLCFSCAPRKLERCVRCGQDRRVNAITPDGPICARCYTRPPRRCGVCGKTAPIRVRASGERPDTCYSCYEVAAKECSVCGRVRVGHHAGGDGPFRCPSCAGRPVRTCGVCGQAKPTKVLWPLGPVCAACYHRRRANPLACSVCGRVRIAVGQTAAEEPLCAACSGHQPADVRCGTCREPADLVANGRCPQCALATKVNELLAGADGVVPAQLEPVAEVLTGADNPYPVLDWIRRSPAAVLLSHLANDPSSLTHQALDALPQAEAASYVRGLLVTAGILPDREENLARLQRWLDRKLAALPAHQVTILRPFAEWHILRDARRRSAKGRYTYSAYKGDCVDIRAAIDLLTWLDDQGLNVTGLTQPLLDTYITTFPARRPRIVSFIRWTGKRALVTGLDIGHPPTQAPSNFQTSDDQQAQLHRCLNDGDLPLDIRIVGALVRLYALPITRITAITTGQYHRDGKGAYLDLNHHPVALPPKLADLIERGIHDTPGMPGLRRQIPEPTSYLLPGRSPGQPRNPAGLAQSMSQHGLPVRAPRNTAMIETVSDLPPVVIADLFGLTPVTAHRWAVFAADNWADYLAALHTTDHPPHSPSRCPAEERSPTRATPQSQSGCH